MTTIRVTLTALAASTFWLGSAATHAQRANGSAADTASVPTKKEARVVNQQTARAALTRAKGLHSTHITVFAREGGVTLAA